MKFSQVNFLEFTKAALLSIHGAQATQGQTVTEETTIKVRVQRGTADDTPRFDRFEVPAHDSQTVLDVVSWIQQHADPGLTYRFACRVGMCGSCAMMVNGVPRWTCRTHVRKVLGDAAEIEIRPLRNLPVIKDLAADLDPFFDKWVAAEGRHHPTRTRHDPIATIDPASADRTTASAGIECINCAVCYAACDTVTGNPDYLGPAALQRAWTLFNDAKEADRDAILDAVTGPGGCTSCHSMGSCTAYCPNDLDPMSAIAGLKRAAARRYFRKAG